MPCSRRSTRTSCLLRGCLRGATGSQPPRLAVFIVTSFQTCGLLDPTCSRGYDEETLVATPFLVDDVALHWVPLVCAWRATVPPRRVHARAGAAPNGLVAAAVAATRGPLFCHDVRTCRCDRTSGPPPRRSGRWRCSVAR